MSLMIDTPLSAHMPHFHLQKQPLTGHPRPKCGMWIAINISDENQIEIMRGLKNVNGNGNNNVSGDREINP